MITVAQSVITLPYFMKAVGSLPCSQQPVTLGSSSSLSLAQQPLLSQGLLQKLLPAVPIPCNIPPISLPQLPGIFRHTIFSSHFRSAPLSSSFYHCNENPWFIPCKNDSSPQPLTSCLNRDFDVFLQRTQGVFKISVPI